LRRRDEKRDAAPHEEQLKEQEGTKRQRDEENDLRQTKSEIKKNGTQNGTSRHRSEVFDDVCPFIGNGLTNSNTLRPRP
jgi:hypothetical protein